MSLSYTKLYDLMMHCYLLVYKVVNQLEHRNLDYSITVCWVFKQIGRANTHYVSLPLMVYAKHNSKNFKKYFKIYQHLQAF